MGRWYALALIVAGVGLILPAGAPRGEEGLLLYGLLGWLFCLVGMGWMAVLIFMAI